jgi:hypothetical protein
MCVAHITAILNLALISQYWNKTFLISWLIFLLAQVMSIFITVSYPFVLNVNWMANPRVPIHYTVYHTVAVYLLTNNTGVINSVRWYCSLHILFASSSLLSLFI